MANAPLEKAWYRGRLQPLATVCISPLDRGFLFGDGVYEVIPYYDGKPLGLKAHLQRLKRSLKAIGLKAPMSMDELTQTLATVVEANGTGDQSVYLQISRSGDIGRDHQFPKQAVASLFIMSSELQPLDLDAYQQGFAAVLVEDERWLRCDIKSTSLLANVLARENAVGSGAIEALLQRDDELTEGAASAVACVIDGVLVAPPDSVRLLPSVTRSLTWALAHAEEIPTDQRPISIAALRAASEILIMSSTKEIAPITRLDGEPVGNGRAGPVWRQLFAAYQQLKIKH